MSDLESQALEMMAVDNDPDDTIHQIQNHSRAVCINIGDFYERNCQPVKSCYRLGWRCKIFS